MKQVPLTQDKVALVDDADFERVMGLGAWHAIHTRGTWYAAWSSYPRTYLHRFIMGPPADMEVDHRDGNGLNNQRENLRICTHAQNLANQKKQEGCSSRFKGVTMATGRAHQVHPWKAQIKVDGVRKHLGYFATEEEAALAYNEEAIEAWGEFARPNIIGLDAPISGAEAQRQRDNAPPATRRRRGKSWA